MTYSDPHEACVSASLDKALAAPCTAAPSRASRACWPWSRAVLERLDRLGGQLVGHLVPQYHATESAARSLGNYKPNEIYLQSPIPMAIRRTLDSPEAPTLKPSTMAFHPNHRKK